MKKQLTVWLRVSIFICIGIFISSLIVFYCNFKEEFISKEISDWGSFSDYLNPFISLASLILIAFITYFVNRTNLLVEKPTIIFMLNKKHERYVVKNIGKGAALNIVLKCKMNECCNNWSIGVICYSLGQNDKLEIFWEKGAAEWIAYYDDIFENHYYTKIKDDYIDIKTTTEKDYKILKSEKKERIWEKTRKD